MKTTRAISALALSIITATTLAACGSGDDTSASSDTTATSGSSASATDTTKPSASASASTSSGATGDNAASSDGAYITLADYTGDTAKYADSKVVYFFHASWCPSCKGVDSALTSTGVPAGHTVVKVDFDASGDLKKKYGVTTQHTFVQVDGDGKQLAKWSGGSDGAAIAAKTV